MHPISRRHLTELAGTADLRIDDVARALRVDLLHARTLGWSAVAESADHNLQHLQDAFDEPSGRFLEHRAGNGTATGAPGSTESLGRVLLSLGETIGAAPDARMVGQAVELFSRALKPAARAASPHAQAFVAMACAAVARSTALAASMEPRDIALHRAAPALMRSLATGLHARFLDRHRPGWPWPEPMLGPESALLPRALIVAGHRGGADTMVGIGLQVLDWLIEIQTAPDGHLSPIGGGGWREDGERPTFDQRPIDVTALLLAAEAAYEATGEPRFRDAMERCYAWFLGANDRGLRVAQPTRGTAAEALTATGTNRDPSAESTLMWLIAAEHIRALRAATPRVMRPMQPGRAARPLQPPTTPKAIRTGASA